MQWRREVDEGERNQKLAAKAGRAHRNLLSQGGEIAPFPTYDFEPAGFPYCES